MTFLDYARAHGLRLDHVIADGRWHRTPTESKPRKRNGAYVWDGRSGAVKDWATMIDFAVYREGNVSEVSRKDWREAHREAKQAEARAQALARAKVKTLLEESEIKQHEYLKRKGFKDAVGFVHPSGDLLIPMREFGNYTQVNSLQRIAPDGKKLFLPGGKAKNSVFIIGNQRAKEAWLCEGYATGLTIDAAIRDMRRMARVLVCFSAGNLVHVAKACRNAFVFADHDTSGTGQEAAQSTGLPWVMSPVVGQDANDIHAFFGLRAVVRTMQPILMEVA